MSDLKKERRDLYRELRAFSGLKAHLAFECVLRVQKTITGLKTGATS